MEVMNKIKRLNFLEYVKEMPSTYYFAVDPQYTEQLDELGEECFGTKNDKLLYYATPTMKEFLLNNIMEITR